VSSLPRLLQPYATDDPLTDILRAGARQLPRSAGCGWLRKSPLKTARSVLKALNEISRHATPAPLVSKDREVLD
jgi:hypothetical protein